MIYILFFIIVLLLWAVVYLSVQFKHSSKIFKEKVGILEAFLLQLSKEQNEQSLKVQLSDDLRIKMKEVNTTLNKEIFDLNYQLFEEIQANK